MRSDYALSTNRWKYNGKELQTTGDLGFLDYGARMYDAGLGRWFGMDPLAEKYSSSGGYVFCGNNPLILVDADGQYFDWYQNAAGTAMLWKDSKEEELFLNGEVYNNVGSSMSLEVDGLYFNYYQNILASTSSEPLNGMESVLSNPSLLPKLLGSNSALSEPYQFELLVRSMHNAQDAFLNHPVTRRTVEALTFVAGGGIESVSSIFSYGKSLIGNVKIPIYRVYGGKSPQIGNFWTPINPKLYGKFYRKFAGLPNSNTGEFTVKALTPLKNINLKTIKLAEPCDGNMGRLVLELKIFSKKDLIIKNVWVNH